MTLPSVLFLKINQFEHAIWPLPAVAGIRRKFLGSRVAAVCWHPTAVLFEESLTGVRVITIPFNRARSQRGMPYLTWMVLKPGLGRCDYVVLLHRKLKFSQLLSLTVPVRRLIGSDIFNGGSASPLSLTLPCAVSGSCTDLYFNLARHAAARSNLSFIRVPFDHDPHNVETVGQQLKDLAVEASSDFVVRGRRQA
jgi:hypothetical protein